MLLDDNVVQACAEQTDDELLVGSVLIDAVFCDSRERWDQLIDYASRGQTVVAIITDLDVGAYARALSHGAAGVVHFDTPSLEIAAVIAAASRGAVVLPVFAAQAIAARCTGRPVREDLTPDEIEILSTLASGQRSVDAARALAMSERTLRRRAHSIFLKLGASNRAEAVRLACDARLLE